MRASASCMWAESGSPPYQPPCRSLSSASHQPATVSIFAKASKKTAQARMVILVLMIFRFTPERNPLKGGSPCPLNHHASRVGLRLEWDYRSFDIFRRFAMRLSQHNPILQCAQGSPDCVFLLQLYHITPILRLPVREIEAADQVELCYNERDIYAYRILILTIDEPTTRRLTAPTPGLRRRSTPCNYLGKCWVTPTRKN